MNNLWEQTHGSRSEGRISGVGRTVVAVTDGRVPPLAVSAKRGLVAAPFGPVGYRTSHSYCSGV